MLATSMSSSTSSSMSSSRSSSGRQPAARLRRSPQARRLAMFGLIALTVVSACGGDSADTDPTAAPTPEATDAPPTDATGAPTTDPGDVPDGPQGDFIPGDVRFRAVNLLDEPVDLYVRTTGFVEAFTIQPGLAPGETSLFTAPPVDGSFVILEAGASDPECVSTCPQIIATLSADPALGPVRTIVIANVDGQPTTFDLWEQPPADTSGSANAMPAADPAAALVVVTGFAVQDADFGLRVAVEGAGVCLESNLPGVLVGGTQTPAFALDGPAALTVHDSTDRDCTGAPVGGPFELSGTPGTRAHLILTGDVTAVEGLVIPFDGDPVGGESGSSNDRDAAIAVFADGLVNEVGLEPADAACVAPLMVDAIGLDILVVDGEVVDLDALPPDAVAVAEAALVEALDVCGIDPSVLG